MDNTEVGKATPLPEATVSTQVDITQTEEFRKALDIAIGKGLASTNQQLSAAKAEAVKLDSLYKGTQERLRSLEDEHEKALGEQGSDVVQGYRDKRTRAAEREALSKERAELVAKTFEIEQSQQANKLAYKAIELSNKGIPIEKLKACETEREMDLVAELYPVKPKEPTKEEETPKVDSAVSSAKTAGTLTAKQVKEMSPEERFARADEIAKLPLSYKPLAQ